MKRIKSKKDFIIVYDNKRIGGRSFFRRFGVPTVAGTFSFILSVFIAVNSWRNLLPNTKANIEDNTIAGEIHLHQRNKNTSEDDTSGIQTKNQKDGLDSKINEDSYSKSSDSNEESANDKGEGMVNFSGSEIVAKSQEKNEEVVQSGKKQPSAQKQGNILSEQNSKLLETNSGGSSQTEILQEKEVVLKDEEGNNNKKNESSGNNDLNKEENSTTKKKNNPPRITSIPPSSAVYFGQSFTYNITAIDDDLEPVAFSYSSRRIDIFSDKRIDGRSLMGSNLLIFTPTKLDIGKSFDFMVVVSDGKENAVQEFSVTVLDPGVKVSISSPYNGQVSLVGQNIFFSAQVSYAGIQVDWPEESFVWSISKDGQFLGTMFGLSATNSFSDPGNYSVSFSATDPETGKTTYSSSISLVVKQQE